MLSLLPTTFGTLSTGTNSTVYSLIRQMKASKYDVSQIIAQLSNISVPANFAAGRILPGSVLDRQVIIDLFRESSSRMKLLFSTANGLATAIGSMVEIFSTEIDKLEKDLDNLDLFIKNYEFLSGKDDFYNSTYIEKFDNLEGEYRSDGVSFAIPDRNGIVFPIGGNGFVDGSSGMFKVGSNYSRVNVSENIASVELHTNYSSYITSESSFIDLFNNDAQHSWNVTIKAPIVLSSSLGNFSQYVNYKFENQKGAETSAEVVFSAASEMDTIRIRPNISNGLQLVQIVAFNADLDNQEPVANQADYNLLLDAPIMISGNHEISFPKMKVSKLIFIFSQKSYTRTIMTPISSEINSKILQKFINIRSIDRRKDFSRNQDAVLFYFNKRNRISSFLKNKNQNKNYYSNPFPAKRDILSNIVKNQIMAIDNYDISETSSLDLSGAFQDVINRISYSLDSSRQFIKPLVQAVSGSSIEFRNVSSGVSGSVRVSQDFLDHYRNQFRNPPVSFASRRNTLDSMFNEEPSSSYEYKFSIRSIEFLNAIQESAAPSRACFVTRKIDTDGQPLAIKMKLDTISGHSASALKNVDIKNISSYELSISNIDNPISEQDWIPIMPQNHSSVSSEVVFFNVTDFKYKTRFKAITGTVILYRDGVICPIDSFSFNQETSTVRLLDNSLYSSEVVFSISYNLDLSVYNPYEIDFVKTNIYKDSIKFYSSNFGSGQRFLRTNQENSIKLEYVPFIRESYQRNSAYNSQLGTVFFGSAAGYSPVRVRMSNGSYAINLTNYTNSAKSVNFYQSETPLFYVSGNNIVFDRAMTSTFFVEYSYIPNSVRIRAIIRKNISGVSMPDKIDTIIAKFKTINYDPYYDKLNFLSRVEI